MTVFKLIKNIHNKYLEKQSIERKAQRGDVIGVSRMLYDHYGIYLGKEEVIHYSLAQEGYKLVIQKTHLADFLRSSTTFFILDFDADKPVKSAPIKYRSFFYRLRVFSAEETVRRAQERIGETEYNLLSNNCEHFAIWCKTGLNISYQIEEFLKYLPKIQLRHDLVGG